MNNYLDKLEFNKILEALEKHCITIGGKVLVRDLAPSNSIDSVTYTLNETRRSCKLKP